MQNRYVGDIGDYAKYSFLDFLSAGQRLGIAWYLFPDESHNADGKHTSYLKEEDLWRHVSPSIFDTLKKIVSEDRRSIKSIEEAGIFPVSTKFASEYLAYTGKIVDRAVWRSDWFTRVEEEIEGCDIIFADPDNGFCEDEKFKPATKKNWKRLPLSEAKALSSGRTSIFYHHNTRRRGGHELENEYWLTQLGMNAFAVKVSAGSARTFFVVNPKESHREAAKTWIKRFGPRATAFRL